MSAPASCSSFHVEQTKSREGQGQEFMSGFSICSTTLPSTVRRSQFSQWYPDTKVTAKLLKYTKTTVLEVKLSEFFIHVQHIRSAPSLLISLRARQSPPTQTRLLWTRYRKAPQHGGSDRTKTTKKVQPCGTENLSTRHKLHGLDTGWASGILSGIWLPIRQGCSSMEGQPAEAQGNRPVKGLFFLYINQRRLRHRPILSQRDIM